MSNYERKRNSLQDIRSKKILSDNIKKKIKTTMIGSISSIEKHFTFLWEENILNEDQKHTLLEKFESLRSEILDKGNHQIRNVDIELQNYYVQYVEPEGNHINFFINRGDSR